VGAREKGYINNEKAIYYFDNFNEPLAD